MPADKTRVDMPWMTDYQFERISPEEQQQAINAQFANVGTGIGGPYLEQGGLYPTEPLGGPSYSELYQQEMDRQRNQQINQNFIDVMGQAIDPLGAAADIMQLDEGSLERYVVENLDLATGVFGLSKMGVKKLLQTQGAKELATRIAETKARAGGALDDMSRMILGQQNIGFEPALVDGYMDDMIDMSNFVNAVEGGEQLAKGGFGAAGVGTMDDLGAFALGDGSGGSSYNDLDFEVARTLDAMKHDPQGLFPRLFHNLNGDQQTQVLNNYNNWLRRREIERPDVTQSGVHLFGGASPESRNIVALPNPIRSGSAMENVILTADDALKTQLGIDRRSAPPAAQYLDLDLFPEARSAYGLGDEVRGVVGDGAHRFTGDVKRGMPFTIVSDDVIKNVHGRDMIVNQYGQEFPLEDAGTYFGMNKKVGLEQPTLVRPQDVDAAMLAQRAEVARQHFQNPEWNVYDELSLFSDKGRQMNPMNTTNWFESMIDYDKDAGNLMASRNMDEFIYRPKSRLRDQAFMMDQMVRPNELYDWGAEQSPHLVDRWVADKLINNQKDVAEIIQDNAIKYGVNNNTPFDDLPTEAQADVLNILMNEELMNRGFKFGK